MRVVKTLLFHLILHTSTVMAFTMPSAPGQVNSTYDEIRTSEGASCRSANGGNLIVHGGVSGASGTNTSNSYSEYFRPLEDSHDDTEAGAYMGFAYSFGGGKKIDCSRLANIEFERAELELEKLRAEVDVLKKMNMLSNLPPLEDE